MREVIGGIQVLRTYLYVPKNPRRTFRGESCSTRLSRVRPWLAPSRDVPTW